MVGWTWNRIVGLNKLVCEASGQPHGVRQSICDELITPNRIAEEHPFIEGNKRTAACLAICLTLERV